MGDQNWGGSDGAPGRPVGPDDGANIAARFAGIGVQFALSMLLGLYAGRWLDGRWGTAPLFLIVGVFVGAGVSFYAMYRALQRSAPRGGGPA